VDSDWASASIFDLDVSEDYNVNQKDDNLATTKLEDWANDVQTALEKMTEAIKNLDARLERIEEPLAAAELRRAWEKNHES